MVQRASTLDLTVLTGTATLAAARTGAVNTTVFAQGTLLAETRTGSLSTTVLMRLPAPVAINGVRYGMGTNSHGYNINPRKSRG
jgi:hypothetical protein